VGINGILVGFCLRLLGGAVPGNERIHSSPKVKHPDFPQPVRLSSRLVVFDAAEIRR
jgi:hypothetical protein